MTTRIRKKPATTPAKSWFGQEATEQRQTKTKANFLVALKEAVGNVSVACEKVGVSRQTYYNWCEDFSEFAMEVQNVKESWIDFTETKLKQQIRDGNTVAILFYLKCQAKERGYIDRVEFAGAPGQPLHIRHGVDMQWLNEELPKPVLNGILDKLATVKHGRTTRSQ